MYDIYLYLHISTYISIVYVTFILMVLYLYLLISQWKLNALFIHLKLSYYLDH